MPKVKLTEVFLVHQQPINIGRKRVFEAGIGEPQVAPHHKLRPEFEKLVSATAANILSKKPDKLELEDMLRDLAHGIEGAEGEDPAELDNGGPKPGTTGGKGMSGADWNSTKPLKK